MRAREALLAYHLFPTFAQAIARTTTQTDTNAGSRVWGGSGGPPTPKLYRNVQTLGAAQEALPVVRDQRRAALEVLPRLLTPTDSGERLWRFSPGP